MILYIYRRCEHLIKGQFIEGEAAYVLVIERALDMPA